MLLAAVLAFTFGFAAAFVFASVFVLGFALAALGAVFGVVAGLVFGFSVFSGSSFFSSAFGFAVSGFGGLLKDSTNLISVSSVRNFCRSMAMPRFAIWMPSM